MKLTGKQIQQIRMALVDAFSPEGLRMMVREQLDESLSAIAGGATHSDVVFNLIEWAERTGKVADLIAGAYAANPGYAGLKVLVDSTHGWYLADAAAAPVAQHVPPGSVDLSPRWQQIGIELVKIPAGEFLYGDDNQRIHLDKYLIAKTPVTNRQYKAFVDATSHRTPEHWTGAKPPRGKENHPVVNVSWADVVSFCRWAGVQLPSERQWEKAARGTDGRIYPWGNDLPDATCCNFNKNLQGTTPVGQYPQGASPYGLLDMAGNVWEWCADWYAVNERRVVRGGAWNNNANHVRAAARGRYHPDFWYNGGGFRCVRSP